VTAGRRVSKVGHKLGPDLCLQSFLCGRDSKALDLGIKWIRFGVSTFLEVQLHCSFQQEENQ